MSTYPYQMQNKSTSNFESVLKQNRTLRLIRPFKGMLFTQELTFLSMEKGRAHFAISRGRLLTYPDERIFLHSLSGEEVFSARVLKLDNYCGELVLGDIKSMGRSWAARSYERVQPHQPTRVMLRCKDCAMSTFLENFSLAGVGLLAYKLIEHGLEPRIGHEVKVDFELSAVGERLSLPGKLVNVSYPGAHLAYIGVQTFPNARQARLMERYITNRKSEIVDEIDQVIHASFVPPSVHDMYF